MYCKYNRLVYAKVIILEKVILELKSEAIHETQLLTYMKLVDLKSGILIHFNMPMSKEGIKRVVSNF